MLIAQECQASGDSLSAVRLLNGLHRESPNFKHLIIAMELMLDALRDLPHLSEKAEEFDIFVKRFKEQKMLERAKFRVRIKPKVSIDSNGSSNPSASIKLKLRDSSLSLEDQIKNNTEELSTKKASNISKIAASNKIETNIKSNNDTDYEGGIDFN